MTPANDVVFLFDVDNRLLNNDDVQNDLMGPWSGFVSLAVPESAHESPLDGSGRPRSSRPLGRAPSLRRRKCSPLVPNLCPGEDDRSRRLFEAVRCPLKRS